MRDFIFTSEHVSPGHPDKMMDSIAEALVDHYISKSKDARVAIDGVVKNDKLILVGELSLPWDNDSEHVVKAVIGDIGYTQTKSPLFNYNNVQIEPIFTLQSPDIAQGVDSVDCVGAGDIGIMFGGAVKEAPDYTCWSHYIARYLSWEFYSRSFYTFPWACPDQKTQVSVRYSDGVPVEIVDIVLCISHSPSVSVSDVKDQVVSYAKFCLDELSRKGMTLKYDNVKVHFNPTGAFSVFGPIADSGCIGRKIVCDQYGGFFPVGGGNLNGKDATKVDRSAVYRARHISKKVVREGLADKCQIQLSYAIGMPEPISVNVDTFGTSKAPQHIIDDFVNSFSYSPTNIIKDYSLNSPSDGRAFSYYSLGKFGHIGKRFDTFNELPWEI